MNRIFLIFLIIVSSCILCFSQNDSVIYRGSGSYFVFYSDSTYKLINMPCDICPAFADNNNLLSFGGYVKFKNKAIYLYSDTSLNDVEMNVLDIPEAGTIEAEIIGSEHDAVLQIIVKKGQISSIAVNVSYSFGENMKKAGLNTLLGMGTVFIVLILISLIISAFGIIPKIQAASAKKKEAAKTPAASTVDQTIAQIVEKEELADDTELVAVIAAAIASYEGTSADGFVVRSIRRAR